MAEVPDDLKCPVCWTLFKEPYCLKVCGHHVCMTCLQSLVAPVSFTGEDQIKFECPIEDCTLVTYLSITVTGNKVKIDFEASGEIMSNPTLGRIAQSVTQLEQRLEKERKERLEKERTIQELKNSNKSVDGSHDICRQHESQGMELNLYCIQCDIFICHLCANKPHTKHCVIAASCRDEYKEKKDKIIESIRNAERCVDLIGSELQSQCTIVKKFEEEVTPLAVRMTEAKNQINEAVELMQGFYRKLENYCKMAKSEVQEPMVDATSLLRDLVAEITSARKNLENGLVRKFDESNTRLALLQSRTIKEPKNGIQSRLQETEKGLSLLEKIGDDIKRFVKTNLDMDGFEKSKNSGSTEVSIEMESDTGITSYPLVSGSPDDENIMDNRDLDGALACKEGDIEKKAYISSLGLGPREIGSTLIEKVDTGVQYDVTVMTDSATQVIPLDYSIGSQVTTCDHATQVANEDEVSEDLRIKRPIETSHNSLEKRLRLASHDSSETEDEPMDTLQCEKGDLNNEEIDGECDRSIEFRYLSFGPSDISVGRFVLVSHAHESEYPWIGKVITCLKKNIRVMWYKGELYKNWCLESKHLDLLHKDTVHATFSCKQKGTQLLMERGLSHEIEQLMNNL